MKSLPHEVFHVIVSKSPDLFHISCGICVAPQGRIQGRGVGPTSSWKVAPTKYQ